MSKTHFTDAGVKRLRLPEGKSQADFFDLSCPAVP